MITRLLIKNFQAIERLDLKLDKVNVIVGRSDVGKSSILRALRWLAFNRPLGDAFIRKGEAKTVVKAKVDGKTILRSKGRENLYQIEKERFVAFGNDPPEAVSLRLQMSSLNFQGQHDSPFWLSLSSGEVAKRLNAVIDLDVIDRLNKEISSRLKERRTLATALERRIEKQEIEVKKFEYVVSAKQLSDQAARTLDRYRQESARMSRLVRLIDTLSYYAVRESKLAGRQLVAQETVDAYKLWRTAFDKLSRLDRILRIVRSAEIRTVDFSGAVLCSESLKEHSARASDLDRLLKKIKRMKQDREIIVKKLDAAQKKLERVESKIERCSKCGQIIAQGGED